MSGPDSLSVDFLAGIVIDLVDRAPAPRHMEVAPEIASLAGSLALFSVEAAGFDLSYAARCFSNDLTVGDVSGAAIAALREHGQRVGPFRRRKIQKIIGINYAEA